ncbi:MAG: hypothetical protein NXH70_02610 [Hyphomonas sp.]|nr:hypothetical protein [Hyphomonas sp.]
MTLFRPNTTCLLYQGSATLDIYGASSFGTPATTPCAVIAYDLARTKTTVRADSSGTRGRGEHLEGVARFLFPKTVTINRGDKVYKDSYWLEVVEIHPRYDVSGTLDHWEVDFNRTEAIDAS